MESGDILFGNEKRVIIFQIGCTTEGKSLHTTKEDPSSYLSWLEMSQRFREPQGIGGGATLARRGL